jgi:hypothetical protein
MGFNSVASGLKRKNSHTISDCNHCTDRMQWNLGSRTPLFTNISVHEQIFRAKKSRMTNGFSDYEHASWQQRQAESISAGVSCCLTLAQYTSLLDFGLRTFRFTNGLQERIKFVNRGPTVHFVYDCVYFIPSFCN